MEIFIAKVDSRCLADSSHRGGRVDAVAAQPDVVAETSPVFAHCVDAQRRHSRRAAGRRRRPGASRPRCCSTAHQLAERGEGRALGTRLTMPPPPPRPKIIALGPLQHLDPLDIVEIAEILRVVADAVDEQIGGGVVAAQGELVAIAFAGAGRRAGHEQQHFGDRAQCLVLDLLRGDDGQRLRDVADRGVGAGAGPAALGAVIAAMAGDDDRFGGGQFERPSSGAASAVAVPSGLSGTDGAAAEAWTARGRAAQRIE